MARGKGRGRNAVPPIASPSDVKTCLERVMNLMAERDGINEDIGELLDEFKEKGVVAKGIRRVASLLRMDPQKRRNDEQMYEDYEASLGALPVAAKIVADGGSYDDAAEETGLSRATVARAVAASKKVSKEKDFETAPKVDVISPPEVATLPAADTRTFDEIAGPIPDRLRRVPA